jgi:rhamnulokinase
VGAYDGSALLLDVVHRFENVPFHTKTGLHWDVHRLFSETITGLREAGPVAGVGVDAWGCDYALLDEDGDMLDEPFHYRDSRTEAISDRAFAIVPKEALYARTGIQHLRFNTLFQLLADAEAGTALERAERIALIPDLFNYWLTGTIVNEATAASTTGLTDATQRAWDCALIQQFALPPGPFNHELVEPGSLVGELDPRFELHATPVVRATAGHDTASAFAAAPMGSRDTGVISCGTWSLVGIEIDRPYVGGDAAAANLSNEWGIDGTTRLLRNVMGLWLLQECRRQWKLDRAAPSDYEELQRLAGSVSDDVPVFDPDLDLFLQPGDMPARIDAACRETGQAPPKSPAELIRSILLSLACAYRTVFADLTRVSGRPIDAVHIVGGGALNMVLCQLTANVVGVPVLAGPVEAAAIGNILVQIRAAGAFDSREEMRACVTRSFTPVTYEPSGVSTDYERFLSVTHGHDRVGVRS